MLKKGGGSNSTGQILMLSLPPPPRAVIMMASRCARHTLLAHCWAGARAPVSTVYGLLPILAVLPPLHPPSELWAHVWGMPSILHRGGRPPRDPTMGGLVRQALTVSAWGHGGLWAWWGVKGGNCELEFRHQYVLCFFDGQLGSNAQCTRALSSS